MRKGSPEGYNAETALLEAVRNHRQENPMTITHYIGFDVHKKSVSYW
jgi:hypothetical protein